MSAEGVIRERTVEPEPLAYPQSAGELLLTGQAALANVPGGLLAEAAAALASAQLTHRGVIALEGIRAALERPDPWDALGSRKRYPDPKPASKPSGSLVVTIGDFVVDLVRAELVVEFMPHLRPAIERALVRVSQQLREQKAAPSDEAFQ